jgi:APA family basic amino acid/polyamine antiporter
MMVGIKLVAILIFVFAVITLHPSQQLASVHAQRLVGVLTGGSIIFFTYIGFDSVSTAAEECRNPQRDLPIGIIATLVVCTVLYVAVAVCLTGLVPWQSMVGDAAPVVNALKKLSILPGGHPLHWIRLVVLFGAIMGMLSSILVYQLGQSRVWFSMSRDGLLPKGLQQRASGLSHAGLFHLGCGDRGGHSVGSLRHRHAGRPLQHRNAVAFVLVSIGVIVLRYREPERRRGFRVPFGPVIPVLSVVFCFLLMAGLPIITWFRFFIWLVIGLVIYFFYSRHRGEDRRKGGAQAHPAGVFRFLVRALQAL